MLQINISIKGKCLHKIPTIKNTVSIKKERIQKQKLSNLIKAIYRTNDDSVVRMRPWHLTGSSV